MYIQRILCGLVLSICLLIGQSIAQTNDLASGRGWVEDPAGTMTLEEVKLAKQIPLDGKFFSRGYSQSTFWIRLKVDPQKFEGLKPDDHLVIRIRPPYWDHVELFDPLDSSDRKRITGQNYDWKKDELQSLNLNFVIPLGAQARDIWLKVRTDKSTMAVIELLPEVEVRKFDRSQELGSMFYIALLIICMGWGLFSWISQPDKLVGLYVVRQALAIAYALSTIGYLRIFTSAWDISSWTDILFLNIVWIFVALVIWFDSQLLKEFKPNRWVLRVFYLMAFGLLVEWILLLIGKAFIATIFNSYIVLITLIFIVYGVLSTRIWKDAHLLPEDQRPVISKTLLVSVYGTVILAVLINRLPFMGLLDAHEGFLYLNLVYAALSSVLMMALILVRASRITKRQQKIQQHLAVVEKEIDQERMYRAEQSDFLKMLAHEMRTLLSVVRISVGKDQLPEKANIKVDRAVTEMNNLIERLLEVERLNEASIELKLAQININLMAQDLISNLSADRLVQIHEDGDAIIKSDPHFVRIILSNLIDNALKYGPVDKPIRIAVNAIHDCVEVTVANVIGSAGAPDQDKLFQKYYRSQGARERAGSGLGLYLIKTLLEKLGGKIDYERMGDEVSFIVSFPR